MLASVLLICSIFFVISQGLPMDIELRMSPVPMDPNNPDFGPDFSMLAPNMDGNGPFDGAQIAPPFESEDSQRTRRSAPTQSGQAGERGGPSGSTNPQELPGKLKGALGSRTGSPGKLGNMANRKP
ncbi:uncharacterized protein LOC129799066 [Phlebotomus papatasi]|uniref:uncharacterized protein LOC129799066 n=1 Tax=Phlebotomus papatasi TaxID=29031 RepID=UPI002483E015|nr:uncharacterized protein LOC129799066 [Phlebotomus papatasi]